MFPSCFEDYVEADSPVRLFDAFVESLDMDILGFVRSKPNFEGRPGYDPRDLLRGYVYGSFYDFFCYLCLVFNSVDFTLLLFTKTMSLTKTFDYH